eukprot:gene347-187_t
MLNAADRVRMFGVPGKDGNSNCLGCKTSEYLMLRSGAFQGDGAVSWSGAVDEKELQAAAERCYDQHEWEVCMKIGPDAAVAVEHRMAHPWPRASAVFGALRMKDFAFVRMYMEKCMPRLLPVKPMDDHCADGLSVVDDTRIIIFSILRSRKWEELHSWVWDYYGPREVVKVFYDTQRWSREGGDCKRHYADVVRKTEEVLRGGHLYSWADPLDQLEAFCGIMRASGLPTEFLVRDMSYYMSPGASPAECLFKKGLYHLAASTLCEGAKRRDRLQKSFHSLCSMLAKGEHPGYWIPDDEGEAPCSCCTISADYSVDVARLARPLSRKVVENLVRVADIIFADESTVQLAAMQQNLAKIGAHLALCEDSGGVSAAIYVYQEACFSAVNKLGEAGNTDDEEASLFDIRIRALVNLALIYEGKRSRPDLALRTISQIPDDVVQKYAAARARCGWLPAMDLWRARLEGKIAEMAAGVRAAEDPAATAEATAGGHSAASEAAAAELAGATADVDELDRVEVVQNASPRAGQAKPKRRFTGSSRSEQKLVAPPEHPATWRVGRETYRSNDPAVIPVDNQPIPGLFAVIDRSQAAKRPELLTGFRAALAKGCVPHKAERPGIRRWKDAKGKVVWSLRGCGASRRADLRFNTEEMIDEVEAPGERKLLLFAKP